MIRILLNLFIMNKDFFFMARITAVALPAAERLKFRGSSAVIVYSRHLKKKLEDFFFIHFNICTIKAFRYILYKFCSPA